MMLQFSQKNVLADQDEYVCRLGEGAVEVVVAVTGVATTATTVATAADGGVATSVVELQVCVVALIFSRKPPPISRATNARN